MEQSADQLVSVGMSLVEDARRRISANPAEAIHDSGDTIGDLELGLTKLRDAVRTSNSERADTTLLACLLGAGCTLLQVATAFARSELGAPERLVRRIETYLEEAQSMRPTSRGYAYYGVLFSKVLHRPTDGINNYRKAIELDPSGEIGLNAARELARLEARGGV